MSEEIGKHKGAVETLLHEQKELSRILQIVNSQLERHITALDEAGVDTDQFIKNFQQQTQQRQQAQQKQDQQQRQSQQKRSSQNQSSQRRQNSGRERNTSAKRNQNSGSGSDNEKEMEDYFEDDDNSSTRDFSPR